MRDQAPNAVSDFEAKRRAEVPWLNQEYIRASLDSDVEWFRAHLADEFVCIESDGSVHGKDGFLRMVAAGSDLSGYRLDSVSVRFHGEVALVQASGSWTTKTGIAGVSRYIDVYVYTDGAWKVVSAQVTRPPLPR